MGMRTAPTVDLDEVDIGQRLGAYEVISGFAGLGGVLFTGFLGGLAVWIPFYILIGLNQFITSRVNDVNSGFGPRIDLGGLWPYVLATGVLGIALAYLRRVSARIEWYKDVGSVRVSLNLVFAAIVGLIAAVFVAVRGTGTAVAASSGSGTILLAIVLAFSGLLINAMWVAAHNLFLRFVAQRNPDAIIERAVRNRLERNKDIRPTRLEDVKVVNGRVKLKGVWPSADLRQEVQASLRLMDGVVSVEFEPVTKE